MTLRDLSHPQWAAALAAARALTGGNPNNADDRASFRAARDALVATLPADADYRDIIGQAVRWYALNDIAAAFVGMHNAELEQVR